MSKTIEVLPATEAQAIEYAKRRIAASPQSFRDTARPETLAPDSEDRIQIDLIGIIGEMTAAFFLGVPYVFTVNTFHKEADIVLPNGNKFEVKATTLVNGPLVVRTKRAFLDQTYVLVYIHRWKPSIITQVAGWIPGTELQAIMDLHPEYNYPSRGTGQNWRIPVDYLKPASTIPGLRVVV